MPNSKNLVGYVLCAGSPFSGNLNKGQRIIDTAGKEAVDSSVATLPTATNLSLTPISVIV